jgi:hypothetical protein
MTNVLFYRMMSKDQVFCYADYMPMIYNEAIFQVHLYHIPEIHRCQRKGRQFRGVMHQLTDGIA